MGINEIQPPCFLRNVIRERGWRRRTVRPRRRAILLFRKNVIVFCVWRRDFGWKCVFILSCATKKVFRRRRD